MTSCCFLEPRFKCPEMGYRLGICPMEGGDMSLPKRRFRAILFDAGDTLIYAPLEEIFANLCADLGLDVELERVFEAYRVFVREDGSFFRENRHKYFEDPLSFWVLCNRQMLQFLGVEKDLDSLAARITQNYPKADAVEWRVFDDVPGTLEELVRMGYVLGVVSNFCPVLKEIFVRLELDHHFKTIVSSEDVMVLKPDPGIFMIALDRVKAEPQESIYVGNVYDTDVVGSRRAGMTPVLIDRRGELLETDCPKISELGELIGLLRRTNATDQSESKTY